MVLGELKAAILGDNFIPYCGKMVKFTSNLEDTVTISLVKTLPWHVTQAIIKVPGLWVRITLFLTVIK